MPAACGRTSGRSTGPLNIAPDSQGADFRLPAEWSGHRACWLAWPSHEELWGIDLEAVRREFHGLCSAITDEQLEVLVLDRTGRDEAAAVLDGLGANFHELSFGDVWLRDTAPLFVRTAAGRVASTVFEFNGWGGKYLLAGDRELGARLARLAGHERRVLGMVFEGGAVDVDGQGRAIVSRDCLLSASRNPGLSQDQAASLLAGALGLSEILWLEGMLAGDHTDGHVDTLARFAPGGRVLCARASRSVDHNHETLDSVAHQLGAWLSALDRPPELVELPSPGPVFDDDGQPLPASYLNFYISNAAVVVPVFGTAYDDRAVDIVASCFPDRPTLGLEARHLLKGGGAFHCITMQEPGLR